MWLGLRFFTVAICLVALGSSYAQTNCVARQVEHGIVCVCNATYCDQPGLLELPPSGQYLVYTTSEAGERFNKKTGSFVVNYEGDAVHVTVDPTKTYQKIYGFGGSMTDATGINLASLSHDAQELFLKSYFSPEGLHYNLVRLPIGGTDFSTHAYSYDDDFEDDTTLEHFNLTAEDYVYKIPYVKRAQQLASHRLLLYTAPWSAPKWMKTNNEFNGSGRLKADYQDLWAQYIIRFLQAYSALGLDMWALSLQNEPTNGLIPGFSFNCMGWTAAEQRDWLANYMGPALVASGFSHVQVLAMDDQRYMLPSWTKTLLEDSTARNFTAGMALHWYWDSISSAATLDQVHELYPDVFLIYTEACNGVKSFGEVAVTLGSWSRGEKYAHSIIETMNHWVAAWTDWNMALDAEGKPNWAENFVDSPIIVNSTADEFYKQPMFYAIGHFSKFVPENSTRISLEIDITEGIEGTAFTTPEGSTVVVLLNRLSEEITTAVSDSRHGQAIVTLPPLSLHTLIWQQ